MRVFTLILALLAFPALAVAQQADIADEATTPTIEVEATTPTLADDASLEAPELDETTLEIQNVEADDAAMQQGPESRQWWWMVGAIVVAGIVLAVLL